MDPRKTPDRPDNFEDAPALEEQDWDALESGSIRPDSIHENGDLRYEGGRSAESLEEEDDNAYQNSDEALPEDREETSISRDPAKEKRRYDDTQDW